MPILFISHASEDKAALVRPLAATLKQEGFDVWYDEYELTLGDRLRQKIDEGLRKCDYGIVVLSHSFFAKDWPQDELEGLLALEKKNGKMILPLWHEVTRDDVLGYSPILAGRLGGRTDQGIPFIVEGIRRAIEVSTRSRELQESEGIAELLAISEQLTAKEQERSRMHAADAGAKVAKFGSHVTDELKKSVASLGVSQGKARFSVKLAITGATLIDGPDGKFVEVKLKNDVMNNASGAEICAKIGQSIYVEHEPQPARELERIIFKPRMIDDDNVYWSAAADQSEWMTPIQTANFILKRFAKHLR